MASTYTPIETYTVSGTSTNTITFNSFSGYTDLEIVCNVLGTNGSTDAVIQFNGDTGANYSQTVIRGNGTTAQSVRYTVCYLDSYSTWDTGKNTVVKISLMNYENTTTYKSFLTRISMAAGDIAAAANLWRSTSAITSLTIKTSGGNAITAGSTFTLYGIKAA